LFLLILLFRISQESTPSIHESGDLQHKEAGSAGVTEVQGPCQESQMLGKSARDTLRDVKFGCNVVSLPWTEQCRALTLEILSGQPLGPLSNSFMHRSEEMNKILKLINN